MGCDVVGVARTGSGKTLAYLLPALVHIEAQEPIGQNVPFDKILVCRHSKNTSGSQILNAYVETIEQMQLI